MSLIESLKVYGMIHFREKKNVLSQETSSKGASLKLSLAQSDGTRGEYLLEAVMEVCY